MEVNGFLQTSILLILQTLVLITYGTRQIRLIKLQNLSRNNDQEEEVTFLQEDIYRFRIKIEILRKQVQKSHIKPRYTRKECLQVNWYLKYPLTLGEETPIHHPIHSVPKFE